MPERTSLDDLDRAPHAEVFDRREPRAVRLRLEEGESVPEHRHPDSNVVFHLVEGRVDLTLGGETYDLEPGDLVRFDGDQQVSPTATADATAVVVFAPQTDE